MRWFLLSLALAAFGDACLREWNQSPNSHRKRVEKRQADFPPILTEQETFLVNSFDNNTIDEWSYYYTHESKLAGLGKVAAQWTADKFSEFGWESRLDQYEVYLSYPVSASLHVNYPNGTKKEISLVEDKLAEDDVTNYTNNQPTFHGFSASGDVSAEYVYIGRGQQVDFDRLVDLGVELDGKIGLAKYGGPFRGLKVKNAQEHGMIGVVIFSDIDGDGNITVNNGYEAYPDGPARNPTAVQKGSVLFLSQYPGDPTTPGYASKEGVPRADPSEVIPRIPSVPISYTAGQALLQALDGHGISGEEVNRTSWIGKLNATYSTGPAPGITLDLHNLMKPEITTIYNAIAFINGTNSDETIVLGNHRDTWMIGGAGDPNSGSAIMVELSKALGKLVKSGWKPKRNIVLASWDAEEYGLIGSTEWVEDNIDWLTETSVAYLNIDVAVSGPLPDLSATPELHTIATGLMKKIIHPNFGAFNESLYDAWEASSEGVVGVLGSGSDFTAFLHRGISSLDIGSGGGPEDPVWHYHSNYDTYHWMANFGDPGFHVHSAMGQYFTLLAYHIAEDTIIPFDVENYGVELRAYHEDLQDIISSSDAAVNTTELLDAISVFETRAKEIVALASRATLTNDTSLVSVVNHKYRDFQRGFTSQGGLPTREFFRHVITAPGRDTGYAPVTFPGVTESLTFDKNATLAQLWVGKTAEGILRAADILKT